MSRIPGRRSSATAKPAVAGGKRASQPRARGRREAKKSENLMRIKIAAQECFVARGFEDATMREIAARARVGLGTLFRYAENKRDLLLIAINDDIDAAVANGNASIDASSSLAVNIISVLRPVYAFFMRQPVMSRLLLGELFFYDHGPLAKRFRDGRNTMLDALGECLRLAVRKNEIAKPRDIDRVVWLIYGIYHAELRYCLSREDAGLDEALARFEGSLKVFMHGLPGRLRRPG